MKRAFDLEKFSQEIIEDDNKKDDIKKKQKKQIKLQD